MWARQEVWPHSASQRLVTQAVFERKQKRLQRWLSQELHAFLFQETAKRTTRNFSAYTCTWRCVQASLRRRERWDFPFWRDVSTCWHSEIIFSWRTAEVLDFSAVNHRKLHISVIILLLISGKRRLGTPFGRNMYGQIIFQDRSVALMELVNRIRVLKSFRGVTEVFFSFQCYWYSINC